MLTLILPGYSAHNKDWALTTSKNLELGHEVRPVLWEHWDNPDMTFDAKDKAAELVQVAMDDSVNIVSKSIGTLVASYIIEAMPSRVEKVVLCGIPLNDATLMTEEAKEVYRSVLREFPAGKIVCFQNVEDPLGSYDEVKDFLTKINAKIKIISKPRNDHEYPYYSEFKEFLKG